MSKEFRAALKGFKDKAYLRTNKVVNGVVAEAFRSVQTGSELTGAPGQPVDTGRLRSSWHITWQGREAALISTNVVYAEQIEDGTRAGRELTLRSQVGGFHSVKLTLAGAGNILRHVVNRETNGESGGTGD
jgi:hypothetical protein